MITFGVKEKDVAYVLRPAVYGLLFRKENEQNVIAIIRTSRNQFFLPGGGIEDNETHEACLKRETIEEVGMEVEVGNFIGCAERYFYSTTEQKYYISEGHFYLCNHFRLLNVSSEEDHFLEWMKPLDAAASLYHEHQSWAVKKASNSLSS
ncbi:NUDIX hydrolase [Longirhabdus pacifica]|uniref:NUDIX hydrolase n=1 Tax=Longirhabdus pacifica TaxID=2305227 RepID=UPI0010092010|nr:NUDIX domain-containing protein [Longirhabdus pacifica]